MERCIAPLIRHRSDYGSTTIDGLLIDHGIARVISSRFEEWEKAKGLRQASQQSITDTSNSAAHLVQQYDVSVPIAKGGLFAGYMFEQFGLPSIICEYHSKGRKKGFGWINSPEAIRDAKVLVLDKDCVSGRTLGAVLKEIRKYSPAVVDVCFNHNPLPTNSYGIGTFSQNIPEGYRNRFYPNSFPLRDFPVVFQQAREIFRMGEKK